MRKNIVCISPEYAKPMLKESARFSFDVNVFPNAEIAYSNLIKINQHTILGYVLLYDKIPEDPSDLINFINFINLIGDRETIVILAIKDSKGFNILMDYVEVDNITFLHIIDFECVTDTFIKRNLYGSILIRKFRPYEDRVELFKSQSQFQFNDRLFPVLPKDVLAILSPVRKLIDSTYTIESDKILHENKDNALVYYLRLNRIKKLFGEEIDYEGMLDRVESSGVNKILYSIVCLMIEGGF